MSRLDDAAYREDGTVVHGTICLSAMQRAHLLAGEVVLCGQVVPDGGRGMPVEVRVQDSMGKVVMRARMARVLGGRYVVW